MPSSRSSEITTSPRAAGLPTGTAHGSHGSVARTASPQSDAAIPTRKHGLDVLPTTPETISEFRAAIYAPPASPEWIVSRVKTTLGLYFRPDEIREIEAMAMQQWIARISEMPGPLAAWAFDQWERTGTHRPAPSHIIKLADARRAELAAAVPKPPEPERPELTPEGRARISAALTALRERLSDRADA